MYRNISLLICILIISFASEAQTNSNSGLNKVHGNIYVYQGEGGNIGLSIGNDGVFMIDDQFATETESILNEVNKITKKPIEFLVNTHHHGDHTGGNANMKGNGTLVFSHDNVRSRLEAMKSEENFDAAKLPIITFSDEMNFYYNDEKIHVFHVHNAHTDGDAMVYFTKSNVLHTGDVFFNGKYPYIDLENGGTVQGYIEALKHIKANVLNAETKIIPGHGPVGTIKDVEYSIDMLNFLRDRIHYYVVANKSVEEVIEMKEFAENFDAKGYGEGYISTEKMIRTLYTDAQNVRKK